MYPLYYTDNVYSIIYTDNTQVKINRYNYLNLLLGGDDNCAIFPYLFSTLINSLATRTYLIYFV